ncbi:Co2+/Mg2+ efflux protein ApaG [Myxococcus stipitatus]|uniref:Co2+/Mg2+ efflux protein ApaG n=1 Tax=Myxococcus stipitatus TaxID=83455 RepID=UPI001F29015F|nr:Co2+/Mg2+ efflux protein ApaG [Myxococcus stipitatus]MCE9669605.1 Co2+/Mg2+ efflux protein ApaG [Myxococcus stipitatus]
MSSTATTDGIRITVKPAFWPERSSPESGQYAFMYTVEIVNEGDAPAQLRARHWVITDASGKVEEVKGEGVVGRQPRVAPGERFEYTSWAMLRTPFGTMRGSYDMERPDGSRFAARIAEFALTLPNALH